LKTVVDGKEVDTNTIDCTENDGILPTKNFIRFKATKDIPAKAYWI
jgi:hypothetical protein